MRFYSNENFPLAAVNKLRALGHDVLTTLEAGCSGQAIADDEVLAFATQEGRVLLTLNRRDFIKLHPGQNHAGIIVCRFDLDYDALAMRIHKAIQEVDDFSNQLIRVNRS